MRWPGPGGPGVRNAEWPAPWEQGAGHSVWRGRRDFA